MEIEESIALNEGTQLTSVQLNELDQMLQTTSAVVCTRALELLIQKGGYVYIEPIMQDELEERALTNVRSLVSTSGLQAYPNPAHDLVLVKYPGAGITQLTLYNQIGQVVFEQTANENATQFYLNIGHLPSGLYELRASSRTLISIPSIKILKQ